MADDVTSGEIRTRRFDVVRKGYDRSEVERFLAQVARQFDDLESRLAEISDADTPLGIDDPEALVYELAAIGGEVDKILEAARAASEAMRSRAADDVASWTTEATATIETLTSDAEVHARSAREAAWVEGSAMLLASAEESTRMITDAETEALRMRAEAEREAIRHTTDAKRASEEVIGTAENEAEAILSMSRAESERVVRVANHSAELAQERARALEDRRAELLTELESTRSSIGDLETEIESRRLALEEPEPEAVPEYDDRPYHHSDGGTVRIVAGSTVVPLRPVDADSFVAEVAELHRNRPDEESREPAVSGQPTADSSEESVGGRQEPVDPVDSRQESVDPAGGGQESVDGQQPEPESEPAADVDTIGSLFAQLRGDTQPEQPKTDSPHPKIEGAEEPAGEEQPIETVPAIDTIPPVDSLIPVQNRALRSIKRLLVDLQNDALEHLRTDKTWVPSEDFTERFSGPFNDLAAGIVVGGDDGGAASVFATDLYDAVSNAVESTRESGSGERAIAAATSKVFRTWRSDEAERRVVAAATELSERS